MNYLYNVLYVSATNKEYEYVYSTKNKILRLNSIFYSMLVVNIRRISCKF